jgi:YebC/PmpR family DNA-binding regulatory protein
MAGHSKWAQIKRKKSKEDEKRGRLFSKLTKSIIVAARQGGGNPESNPALAAAIEKAKQFNLPQENIDRAIKKATGELEGVSYENLIYEGYAPGGVAIMVEVATDNRNRTAAEMRHIFAKRGGSLGETGSVAWMFERKGEIVIPAAGVSEDDVIAAALDAGAEDVETGDEFFTVYTEPDAFAAVKASLESAGLPIESAEIVMRPTSTVSVTDAEQAKRILRLIDDLEDHDDVQEVYSNFDIPAEIIEEVES